MIDTTSRSHPCCLMDLFQISEHLDACRQLYNLPPRDILSANQLTAALQGNVSLYYSAFVSGVKTSCQRAENKPRTKSCASYFVTLPNMTAAKFRGFPQAAGDSEEKVCRVEYYFSGSIEGRLVSGCKVRLFKYVRGRGEQKQYNGLNAFTTFDPYRNVTFLPLNLLARRIIPAAVDMEKPQVLGVVKVVSRSERQG